MTVDAYKRHYCLCEVRAYLPMLDGDWKATQTHHICGSGGGALRIDCIPNIIRVCPASHDWLETHKLAGFVLCCYVKRCKGELDWAALESIKGKQLPAWLETDSVIEACRWWDWIEAMRVELLEEHK